MLKDTGINPLRYFLIKTIAQGYISRKTDLIIVAKYHLPAF